MRFLFFVFVIVSLFYSNFVYSHEAEIRVVVVGEDSDTNSVSRSNEIYKRVVSNLQQTLIRENIFVID